MISLDRFVFHACSQCDGKWFESNVLYKSLGITNADDQIPEYAFEAKDITCPKCKSNLFEFCFPETTVLVDGCKQCNGVWLDPMEWEQIQKKVNFSEFITCPSCQTKQVKSKSCVQCGIVFEKYKQVQHGNPTGSKLVNTIFEHACCYKIKQEIEWLEVFTPFEKKNKYNVLILAKKNYFGHVYEHSRSFFIFICRQILPGLRPADLLVKDFEDQLMFRMKKHFRLYFHRLDLSISAGNRIGSIKRTFSLFRINYKIEDKHRKEMFKIKGPFFLFLFYIPFFDRVFSITKNGKEVGLITKKWGGIFKENFTDADTFHSKFNHTLTVTEKLLIFGAVFLIDFVSFEENHKKS